MNSFLQFLHILAFWCFLQYISLKVWNFYVFSGRLRARTSTTLVTWTQLWGHKCGPLSLAFTRSKWTWFWTLTSPTSWKRQNPWSKKRRHSKSSPWIMTISIATWQTLGLLRISTTLQHLRPWLWTRRSRISFFKILKGSSRGGITIGIAS